ncbi:MAG: ATP-dependent endonuclease [Planctomycetota bacterium]|nr:MAG: ATP-dependent endonuclease [Planctomycetota bacterium]REK28419.1 MAG: ATP-dependent endonuclease [Planctomycetota bacterium]REK48440.1 MAG: ATP-dependent endonuclease [Planctomycetota bacterium]
MRPTTSLPPPRTGGPARVLLVVEGVNDIEFLTRISRLLHAHDRALPDLAEREQRGEVVFVPFGGQIAAWTHRLGPLGKPEFFLCDRELPLETEQRREAAAAINRRPRCRAVLTRKRSLENYLHPTAILAAGAINVEFGDFDSVAEITAQRRYQPELDGKPWELLTRRAHGRLVYRAKRWLNTRAADHMTVEMLGERDPVGEIISWLKTIDRLAGSC